MPLSIRALLLLSAALAVSGAANPRQLEAVRHFLRRSHERGAVPPPRRLRTFTEPRRQAPQAPNPTPSPWFDCPEQSGLFPDPYDCSSYFQCSYGNAFVEQCLPGLQYNPKTLSCDWPANIDPPCQEIPYPSTGAPVLQEKEQEAVKSQSADPLPTPTPSPWFDCPAQFGVFPDPYDCGSYFQCSYGIPFEEHCQPGLQFNPISGTCDWPANIHPPCQEIPYPSTAAPALQDASSRQELQAAGAVESSAVGAAAARAPIAARNVHVQVPAVEVPNVH